MDRDPYKKQNLNEKDQEDLYVQHPDYYIYDNSVPIPLPTNQYTGDNQPNMLFRDRTSYQYENFKYLEQQPFHNTGYNPELEFGYQYQQGYHNDYNKQKTGHAQPLYEYYSSADGEIFICGVPGCNKRYRTKNGIMYHRKVGCKFEDDEKRFVCKYEGCNNKYRGASGLRYHLIHYHNEIPKKNKD